MIKKKIYQALFILVASLVYIYAGFASSLGLEDLVTLFLVYVFFLHWVFQYIFGYKMYGPMMGNLVRGVNDLGRAYLFGLSIIMCVVLIRAMLKAGGLV